MSSARFESAIPGRERPHTNLLDRAANRIGSLKFDMVTAIGNGITYIGNGITYIGNGITCILYLTLVHYTYHVCFSLNSVIPFNELMHL